MNHDSKKPVSLEDLLHLKRSERPPEAFWTQFESELRAKQLAAIVQRRPWWRSWGELSRGLARQSLPIGATAALALGLLSFHEYRARTARTEVVMPTISSIPVEPAAEQAVAAPVSPAPEAAVAAAPVAAAAEPVVAAVEVKAEAKASAETPSDPFSALVGGPAKPAAAPIQTDTWSHFGDQQLATNALASTVGFAPRSFVSTVSEPLTQMNNPLDERRTALLDGSLPRSENATADTLVYPVMEVDRSSASRLSAERLYRNLASRGF